MMCLEREREREGKEKQTNERPDNDIKATFRSTN